ncbi:MAG: hypothetical protein WDO69_06905 [Pseudomonadota bacterium]
MKSRAASFGSLTAVRTLLALCVLGFAHLLGNAGCSSGAVCYRNTDCPSGSDCKQGQCVRRVASEAGTAGAGSIDTSAAGASDDSQTPDAN